MIQVMSICFSLKRNGRIWWQNNYCKLRIENFISWVKMWDIHLPLTDLWHDFVCVKIFLCLTNVNKFVHGNAILLIHLAIVHAVMIFHHNSLSIFFFMSWLCQLHWHFMLISYWLKCNFKFYTGFIERKKKCISWVMANSKLYINDHCFNKNSCLNKQCINRISIEKGIFRHISIQNINKKVYKLFQIIHNR